MKTNAIIIAIVGLVLLGAGCNQSAQPTQSATQATTSVTITDSGFSPASITIHAGDTVTWTNTSSVPSWPASDPHPSHTDLPGFDALRGLGNRESYQYTFTKVGTWGYHDHLVSFHRGTVIVQ